MRRARWLVVTMLLAATAKAVCPPEQGECLPGASECPACGCPADEHGPVCALVVDQVKQLEGELARLARGERTEGLCSDPFEPPDDPRAPLVDVEISSPEGPAVVGLIPEPKRVEVPGRLTLKRHRVTHVCALVNGRPAQVRLLPAQNGKQLIELHSRTSLPLQVTVKPPGKEALTGWLHAIPPYDWPDVEARPIELQFDGGTSTVTPDRVPTPEEELGVWSIVSVRTGNKVAARLVGPTEKQVTLTPGPAVKIRLSVKEGAKSLPLHEVWFAEVPREEPVNCGAEDGLSRWGTQTLDGGTEAMVEAPPGDRRCLFVHVSTGHFPGPGGQEAESFATVGMRVPTKGQELRRVLQLRRDRE